MSQVDPSNLIINSRTQFMRVRAGPGTGKSFSLKCRVAKLLSEGIEPHKMLVVTFTRVTALDLQHELEGMGLNGAQDIRATTLHALAMRTLGLPPVRAGFPRAVRIVADFERAPMIADLVRAGHGKRAIPKMLRAYEGKWARLQDDQPRDAQSADEQSFEHDLRAWLDFHDVMLMDELVPRLYRHLEADLSLLNAERYSHVLVDEYQDLNKAEQCLCDMIAGHAAVAIVGDEDQSIYGFKHAHPSGIRDWPQDKSDMDDVELVDCHRCPSLVVDAANALIGAVPRSDRRPLNSLAQKGKGEVHVWENWMPRHEASRVVLEIQNLLAQKVPAQDILVLTRDKKYGKEIQKEFLRRKTPAVSYLSEAATPSDSVRHRLQVLSLVADVHDRLALRWLLGEGSPTWNKGWFAKVRKVCEDDPRKAPWQVLSEQSDGVERYGFDARMIATFNAIREEVNRIASCIDIRSILEELFPADDAEMSEIRNIIVEEIESRGADDQGDLQALVSRVRRAVDIPEERDRGDSVRLMTVHKSKGLSAPYTFIVGCIDGVFPKRRDADYDEERRVLYVGVSRVKADLKKGKRGVLVLTYPIRLNAGVAKGLSVDGEPDCDRPNLVQPRVSPFIEELGLKRTRTFYANDDSGPMLRSHGVL